ncbi:MAG: helicase HerA-like domain-containing protein [Rubrimonas sp.]|uniref:helicase HerA-like domain-containing protein n=1 Tax=Rubrimonas sp. TaxID=2036015 RepID=UPI002FDEAD64
MSEIFLGGGGADSRSPQTLRLDRANRHGLITGATGTGKTVTLQILAEGFSAAGVPVFMADVKGDLSGLVQPGAANEKLRARAETIGLADYAPAAFPTVFWDVAGAQGHPVRTTVSEMGPLMLARLLDLSEAQEGVLTIAFRLADEEGLPLLDLKDLQAMLTLVGEQAQALSLRYGNVSRASVGAIQRRLLVLESQGGAALFGEPALALTDIIATEPDGRGRINILAADQLMRQPRLYATLLLWLLSELFETLPEVGDPEKPVIAFFFDEAHLLFDGAPKALVDKVEQVARLIRSKGVGVYFVTQNPADIPDDILGQLGMRVQHALRAYTPRDRKALRAAAETFRPNPAFDAEAAIPELGTGEALVSTLDAKGAPSIVERTLIRPPASTLGPAEPAARAAAFRASPVAGKYDAAIDRESAHEMLAARAAAAAEGAGAAPAEADPFERWNAESGAEPFSQGRRYRPGVPAPKPARAPASARRSDSAGEAFAKSLARTLGSSAGRALVRGVLGGLFKGR